MIGLLVFTWENSFESYQNLTPWIGFQCFFHVACVWAKTAQNDKNFNNCLKAKITHAPRIQSVTTSQVILCVALEEPSSSILVAFVSKNGDLLPFLYSRGLVTSFCPSVLTAPFQWSTFSPDRVRKPNNFFSANSWKHVSASENPAGFAPNGISNEKLLKGDLRRNTLLFLDDRRVNCNNHKSFSAAIL